MGMLNEAKKKESKSASDKEHLKPDPKRKHKYAKPSPEIAGNAPGVETASDADASGDSQPDAADDSQPQPDTDQTESGGGGDSGDAAAQPPQQPQDSPGADDAEQGQQEDGSQSGDAQGSDQQPDGSQQDDSTQGASPQGGDEDSDDASGGAPGQSAGGPQGNAVDLSQVPISPALKEEYIRCNAALYTALYKNDKVAQAVMKGIVPQGPHKIESIARMSLLLFTQINKQLHFVKDTPQVVLPFARDIAEHVLDLATTVKKMQFSDQEAQAAIGALLELVQRVVGVTHGNIKALKHIIPRSQLADAHSKYQQHLQYIKGARGATDQNSGAPQSPGNPGGAPQPGQPDQSQGAPPDQSAPPGGQPQAGAPVTAAPGPGQSAPPGGMLTQAANQPPQGG